MFLTNNQRHDAMCSVSFFNTSRFFLSSSLDLFLANFVWYHRKTKRKVWGISKNKPMWETTFIYYPKHHTRFQHLDLNICQNKKKKEVHKQCAEEVLAFGIRLWSSPSFSFLYSLSPIRNKTACHIFYFSFLKFFFSSPRKFLVF